MNRKTSIAPFLSVSAIAVLSASAFAADPPSVQPRFVRTVVADGKHNAFTAMVKWRDAYWLSFRKGAAHNSGDGDIVVLRSTNAKEWQEALRLNVLPDDRDPEFIATEKRLFLYEPALEGSKLTSYVTYTDDGQTWSKPQSVYEPQFIFWKPVAHGGKFYATAHKKAEGNDGGKVREVHLIVSDDGLKWSKVSTIRKGNWESETTLFFGEGSKLVAFLREKYALPGGFILESEPPYTQWKQRPAGVHFSGHVVYTFRGVTYLFSRTVEGEKQGTRIYTFAEDKLTPYCDLPSGGDCSYPAAVLEGDEMLVSYYSSHEGSTNIYLAGVPLAK